MQLGSELARARRLAGLDQRTLAERLAKPGRPMSQPMVSRYERGTRLPGRTIVRAWLQVTRPPAEMRATLRTLLETAHNEIRPWGDVFADETHLQREARERNAAAAVFVNFQPTVLPGLLQTETYARRVFSIGHTRDVDEAVASRIAGQAILREPGRRFDFLIAERLLRFVPGPPDPGLDEWEKVTAPQLRHLLEVAALDTVNLAVLPDSYGGRLAWHNFIIREPADGSPPYVTAELIHGPTPKMKEEPALDAYRERWAEMWAAAWKGDQAREQIERVLTRGDE